MRLGEYRDNAKNSGAGVAIRTGLAEAFPADGFVGEERPSLQ
jgi:hypothetical protein